MAEIRDQRIVFVATLSEITALDSWRRSKHIDSRGEAIRRLIVDGISAKETRQQFIERLAGMSPEDAAREACGHPLVREISFDPTVIRFVDGVDFHFVPGGDE